MYTELQKYQMCNFGILKLLKYGIYQNFLNIQYTIFMLISQA